MGTVEEEVPNKNLKLDNFSVGVGIVSTGTPATTSK